VTAPRPPSQKTPENSPPPPDVTQEMLDLGREIRVVQERLLVIEKRERFAGDDSADFWSALTAFCGVMWRLTDRWASMTEDMRYVVSQQKTLTDAVDEIKKTTGKPVSDETLSELARRTGHQVSYTLDRNAVRAQHRVIWGAVIAAVALVAIGWLAAGWWHPRADISGMTCQDEANGGRVCYMWVTPPPGQEGKR